VVAWIAGHSHVNTIEPYPRKGDGGFWSVRLAAEADWPQQNRLVQIMDNRDGTLSIFGTILDTAAPAAAPLPNTPAAGMTDVQLTSLGRTFSFNDPQTGSNPSVFVRKGEGDPDDRNVELLVGDPRKNPIGPSGKRCANVRGRIRGKRLHRAVLGRKRATIRRAYPRRRSRTNFDYFCLSDGKRVRAGFPTRKLRRQLGRRRSRRVRGRAVLILTNSRRFSFRRVRVGSRLRTLRRRLRGEQRVHRGFRSRWYTVRRRKAMIVFRVKGGRVREIGIASKRLARSRRGAKRLIKSYRGF
jgi:hypothetical protein